MGYSTHSKGGWAGFWNIKHPNCPTTVKYCLCLYVLVGTPVIAHTVPYTTRLLFFFTVAQLHLLLPLLNRVEFLNSLTSTPILRRLLPLLPEVLTGLRLISIACPRYTNLTSGSLVCTIVS